jgi:phage gpG-like protein
MPVKPRTRGRIKIDHAKVGKITEQKLIAGVRTAAEQGRRLLNEELRQPGKGELRGGGMSRASRPGDPPASDTGALRRSLAADVSRKADGWVGTVSANKEYAAPLEYGTEKIKPRPFMALLLGKYRLAIMRAFERGAKRG